MSIKADLIVFGAVGVGLYVLAKKLGVNANTFNPVSDQNAAYKAANGILQFLTGDKNQTVGGAVFDAVNPRAGLAANEFSPAPGIIVTVPKATADGATTERAWGSFLLGENTAQQRAIDANPADPLAYGYRFGN